MKPKIGTAVPSCAEKMENSQPALLYMRQNPMQLEAVQGYGVSRDHLACAYHMA